MEQNKHFILPFFKPKNLAQIHLGQSMPAVSTLEAILLILDSSAWHLPLMARNPQESRVSSALKRAVPWRGSSSTSGTCLPSKPLRSSQDWIAAGTGSRTKRYISVNIKYVFSYIHVLDKGWQ